MKPCPKCGGWNTAAMYRPLFWVAPDDAGVAKQHGWYLPPDPLRVCHYGECPAGEHLHRQCACGYRWTDAVKGQELGTPVPAPPAVIEPPPDKVINASSWRRLWSW